MFLDEATIDVSGGDGGSGCVGWRREKYVAKGGPDGGDGGQGGNIIFRADSNTDTLTAYSSQKRFAAEAGKNGAGQKKAGRSGEDLVLLVPPGTIISETSVSPTRQIADLSHDGDQVIIVHGGRGGYGNAHFTSSVRQRPDFAEKGEPGERKTVHLELKMVADVGIIGFPSVGKSTLISIVSSAKPKIAAYEFTTLIPNLGVVTVDDRSFVICDVPGLIEGASEGKGLGDAFLKHIERCGVLLHILDIGRALRSTEVNVDALVRDYQTIRSELLNYSPTLADKPEIVVLNKTDLVSVDLQEILSALKTAGVSVHAAISTATTDGVQQLMRDVLPVVLNHRESLATASRQQSPTIVAPQDETFRMGAYRVEVDGDLVRVYGERIEQLTIMTEFGSTGGARRFRDVCERIGLRKAVDRIRPSDDSPIYIGEIRVDGHW